MSDQSSDIKYHIFTEIRKKIGNIPIHLELTPNRRARLTIKAHRIHKDFVNQRDALQWLIHSYNVKHLNKLLINCHPKEVSAGSEVNKRNIINDVAREISDKIAELEYYTTESFRKIVNGFDALKSEKALSDGEIENVYGMVVDTLKRMLDETQDHRQYEVYKKYLDQLRIKGYRKF